MEFGHRDSDPEVSSQPLDDAPGMKGQTLGHLTLEPSSGKSELCRLCGEAEALGVISEIWGRKPSGWANFGPNTC